jgi:hypothetical protein
MRSLLTLGSFIFAMLVSLKVPLVGFGLICCGLLVYLRPEVPGVGHENTGMAASSSATPPQCEPESIRTPG